MARNNMVCIRLDDDERGKLERLRKLTSAQPAHLFRQWLGTVAVDLPCAQADATPAQTAQNARSEAKR